MVDAPIGGGTAGAGGQVNTGGTVGAGGTTTGAGGQTSAGATAAGGSMATTSSAGATTVVGGSTVRASSIGAGGTTSAGGAAGGGAGAGGQVSTGGATTITSSSTAAPCGAGLSLCPSGCADLSNDVSNCKTCGNSCPAPAVGTGSPLCGTAGCDISCSGNTPNKCGNACRNLATDVNNCRTCGTVCPGPTAGTGSPLCGTSGCDLSCAGDTPDKCGSACRNLATDVNNCRTCGTVCPAPTAGTGSALCTSTGCALSCRAETPTKCGTACVSLTTSANCGSCGNACHANAQCVAGSPTAACRCNLGYTGDGASCALEDECATGNHRCGSDGTCSNGAGMGFSCTCAAGWTLQTGTFPQCYKAGTVTFSETPAPEVASYDFMTGTPFTRDYNMMGDFYALASEGYHSLWSNNPPQRGVVAVSSTAPLLSVPIPTTGYGILGVPLQLGGTYVALAKDPNINYYIVLRVTALPANSVTFDWVLVYRPGGG